MTSSPVRMAAALVPLALLAGCGTAPAAPEPLLQPDDLGGVDVVEVDDDLPLGRFLPCDDLADPQQALTTTGVHAEYRVMVDEADGTVVTGAFAPPTELTTTLLAFLDGAPDACGASDRAVVLDVDGAAEVAEEAGVDADDVRLLRAGPEDTPAWRAYVVVEEGHVAVVGAGGTAVVAALDAPATVAAAVEHLRDHDGELAPEG